MCKISQVDKFTQDLIPFYTISQRKQWNANYGYCGETSFITSLMYYGGYMSQYDMRELAMSLMTKKPKNQTVESSQLLLNSSMIYTKVADALHFSYEKYTGKLQNNIRI
jgi:hypothetical protein